MRPSTAAASLVSFALDIGTKWSHTRSQTVPSGTTRDGRHWMSVSTRKETRMLPQLAFFGSIAFSVIAWGIVAARYLWPALRLRPRSEALRPLLILHSFRFLGLAFLVPGVVSPDLPRAFATAAAFGDIVAAALALLSLLLLQNASGLLIVAWIFNVWGSVDLVNAFYQANATGLSPGQLGATYFIPTLIVPLLLITHGLAFRVLLQHQQQPAIGQSRQPALGYRR